MNQESFNKLVNEIMSKGFDETTAAQFAALIGDTPTIDEDGSIVVIEDGRPVVKLKLKYFAAK